MDWRDSSTDGDPTRFDARGGEVAPEGVRDDLPTRSSSIDRGRRRRRRTDDHEGRRAQDLGIGEARFGRVGDVDCTPSPRPGPGRRVKDRRHISR